MSGTDPGPPHDVVTATSVAWAGAWEPDVLAELESSAVLRIVRYPSVLRATAHLQVGGARLVLVAGDEVEGREQDSFAALRDAGAEAIAVLYRPALAHRAPRAVAFGADAALLLPAHPGEVEALVHALLGHAVLGHAVPGHAVPGHAVPGQAVPGQTVPGQAVPGQTGPVGGAAATVSHLPGTTRVAPTTTTPRDIDERVAGEPTRDAPDGDAPDGDARDVARPDRRSLESLIGDAALVHRTVGDLDRLLDRILASFRTRSLATRCSLLLFDRARGELTLSRADNVPEDAGSQPIPLDTGIAGRVATTGRPVLVADVDAIDEASVLQPSRRAEYRTTSCLVLPLVATEGVAGVVCLADKADGAPFTDADLRSLLFLADQSGQALENALKLRQMQDLAVIDELTGLFNRRYFQSALKREVQRARRYDRSLTVAIMDLDKFKSFNDLCGHPAGDRALATVGEVLRTSLREVDIVARHGGEEFAVILPETSAAGVNGTKKPFPFLERLRRRVEETPVEGEEKLPSGKLTISIGVACFPDDADTAADLYQKADEALYASKQHGRNVVTYRGKPVTE